MSPSPTFWFFIDFLSSQSTLREYKWKRFFRKDILSLSSRKFTCCRAGTSAVGKVYTSKFLKEMKQFPDVDFPAGEPGGQFVALVDECCNGEKPQVYCASPFWWRYCLKVDWPDQQLIILYELGDENVSPPAPSVHIFRVIDLSDSSHHKALHYGPLISTVHGKG